MHTGAAILTLFALEMCFVWSRPMRHVGTVEKAIMNLDISLLRQRRYVHSTNPGLYGPYQYDVRITSRTGYNLAVRRSGKVYGAADKDPNGRLRRISYDAGLVILESVPHRLFVYITKYGQLRAQKKLTSESIFIEEIQNNAYNTYKSHKYSNRNWYVGLTRKGRKLRNYRCPKQRKKHGQKKRARPKPPENSLASKTKQSSQSVPIRRHQQQLLTSQRRQSVFQRRKARLQRVCKKQQEFRVKRSMMFLVRPIVQ